LRIGFIDRAYGRQYDERLMSFFNVNTLDDLIMARLMMRAGEKSIEEEREWMHTSVPCPGHHW
jgi:hypothetical protein